MAIADCSACSSRTKAMPLSYGTLSHLCASVAQESASSSPRVRCDNSPDARAQSPKAPSA